MTLRWTSRSARDLIEIHNYLNEHLPALTHATMIALHAAAESLTEMPFRGRNGIKPGTRELVMPRLPFIIVYRSREEVVEILHIHHTSRDRTTL